MAKGRYVGGLFIAACLIVLAVEALVVSGSRTMLGHLDAEDRVTLYKQVTPVAGLLAGFISTAVAILATSDVTRKIVEELKRGESFGLLAINLLAAIALLFLLSVAGIVGAVVDDGRRGACGFELVYEALVLASVFEFAVGGFYFAIVTYKLAVHQ